MTGKIILVNGASSSGKSTLCRALQAGLDEPFWHYSIDHFRDASVLPMQRIENGDFSWSGMRAAFFEGFHRCTFGTYDIEVNSIQHLEDNKNAVLKAWESRTRPSAFDRMLTAEGGTVQNAP